MLIRDLFTRNTAYCRVDTNLASAAALMWERDCGVLPVVNSTHKVEGILTDRDICMAVATRDQRASLLQASDVMSSPVFQIRSGDTAAKALKTMRDQKVRRLPVVDDHGSLEGMLSINDLILAAKEPKGEKPANLTYEEVMQTLKVLCAHSARQRKEAAKHEFAQV